MESDNKISKNEIIKISSEFKMYADCLMPTRYDEDIVNIKRLVNFIDHNPVISDFLKNKRVESNIQIISFNSFDSFDLFDLYMENFNDEITITHQFLQYGVKKFSATYKSYADLASKAGFRNTNDCTRYDDIDKSKKFYHRMIKPFVNHIKLYLNKLQIDWGDDEKPKSIINLYGEIYVSNLGGYMNNPINNDQRNSSIGVSVNTGNINSEKLAGTIYEGQKQNLAEAATEIRELLEELSQTYPTSTTAQKMEVAAKAINRIESDPIWKKQTLNAVKGGSLAALEKAIDNPLGAFVVGAVKAWQETEIQ